MNDFQILRDLIEICTVEDKENENVRTYLKQILKPLAFTFEEIGKGKKKVLIAKRKTGGVGFVCHTDTVSSSTLWTKDALSLTLEKDKLYGLGTSDMKGGIAALLEALLEVEKDLPCTCYFTFDEEIGFSGIEALCSTKQNFPSTLIFPEPTDLIPIIANKGCLEFSVTFFGKSAHSSTPHLGENAIYKAMAFIEELKREIKVLEREQDFLYEIPYTTFNLAKVEGGTTLNKVPDSCMVAFDFRTISNQQERYLFASLETLTKKYNATLEVVNQVSCARCEDVSFQQKAEKLCEKKCSGLNYVTEASFFPKSNILILGPGPVTAHQEDEYITVESYQKTVELYKRILMEW